MVHKHELHELTVTRTSSKASGLIEFIHICLSGMLVYIIQMLTIEAFDMM